MSVFISMQLKHRAALALWYSSLALTRMLAAYACRQHMHFGHARVRMAFQPGRCTQGRTLALSAPMAHAHRKHWIAIDNTSPGACPLNCTHELPRSSQPGHLNKVISTKVALWPKHLKMAPNGTSIAPAHTLAGACKHHLWLKHMRWSPRVMGLLTAVLVRCLCRRLGRWCSCSWA